MLNLAIFTLPESVLVRHVSDHTILDNGRIQLNLDQKSGLYDVTWGDAASIQSAAGEVRLVDGRLLKTTDYKTHELDLLGVKDKFGTGIRATVHHRSPGEPELRQIFWVYEGKAEATTQLELLDPKGSNYLAPVVTETPVKLNHEAPLNALFVPWDNDMYFRFRSDGWGEGDGDGDGSYEVGSLYDDSTRKGIIVGSIDHDLWKSAVRFKRNGGVKAFAGVVSKYTHDDQPHGTVPGPVVQSPRMVIGLYDDWRKGLERYGDLNAIVKPALPWKGKVPFGWNSWSGHKTKVNAENSKVATEFIRDDLPKFRSGGTAYVNFDSFWSNLSRPQLLEFVKRAHDAGLKTGIYWTPFACWGGLDNTIDPGSPYKYRDICLKNAKGELLPKLDGAYPVDPTHPGTLSHIDLQMKNFVDMGFDYVKLDFLSHGAIEGAHYDPKVPTGTAAYAFGMQRIVDDLSPKKIGRPFFISLSIAPMFPHGYAHSRRISCDVFANIGASEYLLNSTNYGWWPGKRLYAFDDPDSACVYQPMDEPPVTEAEAVTRFTASVISGGMMIQGDDLTKPEARERVKRLFNNAQVLALAQKTPQFWPVDGNTETKAGDAFYWRDGKTTYVAVFNFSKDASTVRTVPLARMGLKDGAWTTTDLWTGEKAKGSGDLKIPLAPMSCKLLKF